jgi:hypothetical protein
VGLVQGKQASFIRKPTSSRVKESHHRQCHHDRGDRDERRHLEPHARASILNAIERQNFPGIGKFPAMTLGVGHHQCCGASVLSFVCTRCGKHRNSE